MDSRFTRLDLSPKRRHAHSVAPPSGRWSLHSDGRGGGSPAWSYLLMVARGGASARRVIGTGGRGSSEGAGPRATTDDGEEEEAGSQVGGASQVDLPLGGLAGGGVG